MTEAYVIAIAPSDTRGPVIITRLGDGEERTVKAGFLTTDRIAEAILVDQGVTRGAIFLAQWFARELLLEVDPTREGVVTIAGEKVRNWLKTWRTVIEPGQGQVGTC